MNFILQHLSLTWPSDHHKTLFSSSKLKKVDSGGGDGDNYSPYHWVDSGVWHLTFILFILGMRSKKKPCIFKDIVPIEFTLPPPLSLIRTNLNWDLFEHQYPSPPFLQLGQYAFKFFDWTWAIGEKTLDLCVCLCLSACYFVDSCPLRALQRVLEDPRALKRA